MRLTGQTAMCIEDEPIVAADTARMLAGFGFGRVLVAHDLDGADALLGTGHPDIAVLDVFLGPGQTSIDLGLKLAASGVRVVFVSGYSHCELDARIQGFRFVEKPFAAKRLALALT